MKGMPLTPSRPVPGPFDFERASPDEIALFLAEAALAAGPAVMDVYEHGGDPRAKADGSPVTLADLRAEAIVCGHCARAVAQPPIVAEESTAAGERIAVAERFLLVDPLDGTREFVARNGEFTINVALIEKGRPIAGAVYAPALARLWFGGDQAFVCDAPVGAQLADAPQRRGIRVRPAPAALIALASRSHGDSETEAFLGALPIAERRSRGSSLKFCTIAEGLADVYPRFGPTMEWDTAAGDAVLRAAGGIVLDRSGAPLAYGKIDSGLRNGAFVAWGDAAAARRFGVC
jgi:3'(2'), 5'-bisphosphate nucleotidase